MKLLQFDTPPPPAPATSRPQPAHVAIDDWQRAWQAREDEGGLPDGSGSGPATEASRNDSVGLKSDLQGGAATEQVKTPATGRPSQADNARTRDCRSDFSPTLSPESATTALPPLQGEGRGGDGADIAQAIPLPSSRLKGEEQPLPRPLKAGQLAWQSTQAMAQRARRNDEPTESLAASLLQPAPLSAPMQAPPLPPGPPSLPGELLLAAVERLLVTEPDGDTAQQVHLTFAEDWFSETAVTLQRTGNGWQLDIASASPRISAALQGACHTLQQRFAQRGLGRLDTRIRTCRDWDSLEQAT